VQDGVDSMINEVELEGFDEESISFTLRGSAAKLIATMCGDPFGFAPNRTKAEVCVTLYGEDLTREFCNDTIDSRGDDSSQGCFTFEASQSDERFL